MRIVALLAATITLQSSQVRAEDFCGQLKNIVKETHSRFSLSRGHAESVINTEHAHESGYTTKMSLLGFDYCSIIDDSLGCLGMDSTAGAEPIEASFLSASDSLTRCLKARQSATTGWRVSSGHLAENGTRVQVWTDNNTVDDRGAVQHISLRISRQSAPTVFYLTIQFWRY